MDTQGIPLTLAVYTQGSCLTAQIAIEKILKRFAQYGSQKHVAFVGMPVSELPKIQQYFTGTHIVTKIGQQTDGFYIIKPIYL